MIKIFKTRSERILKKYEPLLKQVLTLEDQMKNLSDEELRAKTDEFRERYKNGETLDQMLPEAFAVCREASWRTLGMKHFPCQIQGGIILHNGHIAEMKTGEGKTLVVTLPAYLNAITSKPVHVITVNEYLAKRDSEWMGKVYRFLGLRVGCILNGQDVLEKKHIYQSDIIYGTNSEFAFDYLRDHMASNLFYTVQGELHYAIIDEVDSILIDEARTPLIISSPTEDKAHLYQAADEFVRTLTEEDYELDEKQKTIALSESGVKKAEEFFGIENLADIDNINIQHHINVALKAHHITRRNVDYIVKNGRIVIVDQFTGRLAEGKVYNDGLHQAIEVKEGLEPRPENAVDATITYQNYFRLYEKVCGMTGTAMTEADEFRQIYGLECVEIPTNKPIIRIDHPDVIYKTQKAKLDAIVRDIAERYEKGQPVLVGTNSIEKSEQLSAMLKKHNIPHQVLNAKYHEQEAFIVAQAGRYKMVTIATNMAGRGTDILLGGNPEMLAKKEFLDNYGIHVHEAENALYSEDMPEEKKAEYRTMLEEYKRLVEKYAVITSEEKKKVLELGGLYVIGTERNEARRIDNQLRGRSGRQGDPGESRFYLSLEDDLLRLFGGEKVQLLAQSMNLDDNTPLSAKVLSSIVEKAQKTLEGIHFHARKTLLEFDTIINRQRSMIYEDREKLLRMDYPALRYHFEKLISNKIRELINSVSTENVPPEEWDIASCLNEAAEIFNVNMIKKLPKNLVDKEAKDTETATAFLYDAISDIVMIRFDEILHSFEDDEKKRQFLQHIVLQNVDRFWKEHIANTSQLREGIGLRGYGNEDPVMAFRRESFDMYDEMLNNIAYFSIINLFHRESGQEKQEAEIVTK